jgi:pimeloyl-ACP methyl ester carboxylesterase
VDAGGIRTRCIDAGTGDALIMLHGSGGHAEAFARNVVPLSKDFHVYAVDQVGHGYTDYHPTLFGNDATSDHIIRFMDAEGIDSAFLLGESMGGATSVRVALDHPDRVKKVVYVTGAGLQMGEEADKLAAPGRASFQRLSAAATGSPTPQSIRERLGWLFFDPELSITDELTQIRYRIYARRAELPPAPKPPADAPRGIGINITPELLRTIQCPFFFLWTDHNPSMPYQVAEMAHKEVPGSKYYLIHSAGHWPLWEQTEEFNRVVTVFLQE